MLRVIKSDSKCDWLAEFVQQIGEKFFGVQRFEQLNEKQRVGWIRFNNAMARIGRSVAQGEADFHSLLRFLERVGEDPGSEELAELEAELEEVAERYSADPGQEGDATALLDEVIEDKKQERALRREVHDQKMCDWKARRKVQLAWDGIVLGATVSCLVIATLIVLGVVGPESKLIGGMTITAGIALIGLLKVIVWGRWNPAPPGQFR